MTVKELKEELDNFPENWEVVMWGTLEQLNSLWEGTTEVTPVAAPFVATVKVGGKTCVVLE